MWGGDDYASVSARFKWCAARPPSVQKKGGGVNLSGGE